MHGPLVADKQRRRAFNKLEELAAIKGKLILSGISLAHIDEKFLLPRGTAGTTLREPNAAGERAIAAALGTKPHLLWRRRYHASGLRKAPQPVENYERPLQRGPRQKDARI
jgi:Ner family transcriptional regulator